MSPDRGIDLPRHGAQDFEKRRQVLDAADVVHCAETGRRVRMRDGAGAGGVQVPLGPIASRR